LFNEKEHTYNVEIVYKSAGLYKKVVLISHDLSGAMDIGYRKYQQPKNPLQKYIGSHKGLLQKHCRQKKYSISI